jgi:hypothetical protein
MPSLRKTFIPEMLGRIVVESRDEKVQAATLGLLARLDEHPGMGLDLQSVYSLTWIIN